MGGLSQRQAVSTIAPHHVCIAYPLVAARWHWLSMTQFEWHSCPSTERYILKPKVLSMVGRNAEMAAKAQFNPKNIAPPTYTCSIFENHEGVEKWQPTRQSRKAMKMWAITYGVFRENLAVHRGLL